MSNFKDRTNKKLIKIYDLTVCICCLISVALAILDFTQGLGVKAQWLDYIIYGLFVIDYIVRFLLSEEKKVFFNLLAIIPLNSAFRGLRLIRMTKVLKPVKLARVGALFAKSVSKAKQFLNTNGFKYMLCLSAVAVLASSCAMVYFEGM